MYMPDVEWLSTVPPERGTLNNELARHARAPRAATYNWYQTIPEGMACGQRRGSLLNSSPSTLAMNVARIALCRIAWKNTARGLMALSGRRSRSAASVACRTWTRQMLVWPVVITYSDELRCANPAQSPASG